MDSLTTPQQAYELVQAGKIQQLVSFHISQHFTWGEVFSLCQPQEVMECLRQYYEKALIQASVMEKVRATFNLPIAVHTWYRGPAHNKRVGGAPKSQHLLAAATDFHVVGFEGILGNQTVQHRLDTLPFMQTCGLEFTHGPWTHVDSRGMKARF